jgi:DNA-binding NtrC family response regulator
VAEDGRELLNSAGYPSLIATDLEEALAVLDSQSPQLLLVPANGRSSHSSPLPPGKGHTPVVAVTTFTTLAAAVTALKENGTRAAVDQVVAHRELLVQGLGLSPTPQPLPPGVWGMVGASPALRETQALLQKAARSEANILLYGESGTGKELAAHAIHQQSPRAAHPFIAVDCASLPESLLEAELFGYEKGAFTGALHTKPGLMELAHQGTVFLDEVGEIPVGLQAKLLRALQEKEHRRVGGTHGVKFDARVLSASSRDLPQCVKDGTFRHDLFFRLNVIPIRVPPVRERAGDVRLLAHYFLAHYSERDTGMLKSFDPEVLQVFETYPWPGNVRELQNVVRRMCVLAAGTVLTLGDLPAELVLKEDQPLSPAAPAVVESYELPFQEAKRRSMNQFEAAYVRSVLARAAGNISHAAEAAEVDRKTFYRLLKKHHVQLQAHRT